MQEPGKKMKKRIVVAMSGGVDSSVTAALLKEQGHEVIGISMQVWDHSRQDSESAGSCRSLDHIDDARRVAAQIGIPFYTVNFQEDFRRLVIDDFIGEYLRGRTPNPCVCCNQMIKFGLLLAKARGLGAEFLATGHYARVVPGKEGPQLLKGVDARKDQSYFLYAIDREKMSSILFPLGGMTKYEVRGLAARFRLRVAEKSESQEICFIPDNDYVRFLEEERPGTSASGNIVDCTGKVMGSHNGTYRYTVGQRKGLGIAHAHPLYVLGVKPTRNEVVVGPREELYSSGLTASEMNWLIPEPGEPLEATCKIRYRHHPVACRVQPLSGGRAEVRFCDKEKSVTPGQSVVLYDGDRVLGGGLIEGKIE